MKIRCKRMDLSNGLLQGKVDLSEHCKKKGCTGEFKRLKDAFEKCDLLLPAMMDGQVTLDREVRDTDMLDNILLRIKNMFD